MNFHIVTLFPESFESYLHSSILGRAIDDKKIKVKFYNPRDFTKDKFKRIDQKPYGGGPGMVIQAEPVIKAIAKAKGQKKKVKIIYLAPRAEQFSNGTASKISKKYSDVIIVCGRYEGIDARVKKIFKGDEYTVGPYVLTGGELPAMIMMDAISRQIDGVLGDSLSIEERRISSTDVYTRPEVLVYKSKKYKVPKVLLSGNHKEIDNFRSNS